MLGWVAAYKKFTDVFQDRSQPLAAVVLDTYQTLIADLNALAADYTKEYAEFRKIVMLTMPNMVEEMDKEAKALPKRLVALLEYRFKHFVPLMLACKVIDITWDGDSEDLWEALEALCSTQPELDFPTLVRETKRLRRDALIWMSAEDKIVANENVVTFLELPHVVRRLRGDSTLHAKDAFNEESQWAGVPMFNTFKHFALTISWSTACEESKFNKYKFRASKHAAHLQATRVADMLWCAEGPPLGPSVTKDPPWSKTDFYPKKI